MLSNPEYPRVWSKAKVRRVKLDFFQGGSLAGGETKGAKGLGSGSTVQSPGLEGHAGQPPKQKN